MTNQVNLSPGFISIFILLLFSMSCSISDGDNEQINNINNKSYPLADKDLWVYYHSFEKEALLRGYNYDLALLEISGVIENIVEDGVAGTCQYGNHIHHVTIDKSFWENASTLKREMVVYHELGHCVLYKDHNEDYNREGTCLSIMNSGTAPCTVAYTYQNRDYYIDELFVNLD